MTQRISEKQLKALVDRINAATGSPMKGYVKQLDGRYKAQIGHYHLDINIGGTALERIVNEGGGVTQVLHRGTKSDLWDRAQAFLKGFETAQEGRSHE